MCPRTGYCRKGGSIPLRQSSEVPDRILRVCRRASGTLLGGQGFRERCENAGGYCDHISDSRRIGCFHDGLCGEEKAVSCGVPIRDADSYRYRPETETRNVRSRRVSLGLSAIRWGRGATKVRTTVEMLLSRNFHALFTKTLEIPILAIDARLCLLRPRADEAMKPES